MALQEDEENNIQHIIEVEETTEEESIPGPVITNENVEEDERQNETEIKVNSGTTVVGQIEEEMQPLDRKQPVTKAIIAVPTFLLNYFILVRIEF